MKIINFCSSIIEWLGLALSFLLAWTWTSKTDGVDTVDDDHVNDLQDLKVDTDRVPILQNILGGSGFGYWSQSDAAKGVATMTYDAGAKGAGTAPSVGDAAVGGTSGATAKVISYTITSGAFATNDAVGVFTLGACTGRFNDNETVTFGGVETCLVNQPDSAVGVDLMRNTDQWVGAAGATQPNGWTIGTAGVFTIFDSGDGAPYDKCLKIEVNATPDANPWIKTIITTEIGKIYTFRFYFKHGTATLGIIGLGTSAGGIQYKEWRITDAAWAEYSHTFEATSTTTHIHLQTLSAVAGQFELFDEISLYEITPCCTAVDGVAFDGGGWTKDITLDLYRQHWDGGTLTKVGSFYSLKCVPSAANDYINWKYDLRAEGEQLARFLGRTVIIGMWVKTSTASHFRAHIYEQGGANTATDFHTGGGGWEWLEVPYTFGTTATWLYVQFRFEQPPNINGSTIVYLSQPMLIFGKGADAIIGEGNYRAKPQEFIYGEVPILSNLYDNITGLSDTAYVDLNLEADSDAKLPKGCTAILVHTGLKDSGSAAASNVHCCLRRDATFATESYRNSVAGKANNIESHIQGKQGCDIYGDVDVAFGASGAGNLDILMFEYHGVQVS